MPDILAFTPQRVLDLNGDAQSGYTVQFYESGTTTPKTVYSDSALTSPLVQPLTANADGTWPIVFSSSGAVKAVIKDSGGSEVYTVDPCIRVAASSAAASEVTFTPTVDLPYTNVQDAIEGAVASAASGFLDYGLSVTGSSALLASIDATNIPAGAYRFDNTTAGTFPTDVTAANGGIVVMWRELSSAARMHLYPRGSDRVYQRRMASSSWQTWRLVPDTPQTMTKGDLYVSTGSALAALGVGSDGQVLTADSGEASGVKWSLAGGGSWTTGSAVGLTSGSTVNYTGIPASTTQMVIQITDLSMTTGDNVHLRLLDGGVAKTTGYTAAGFFDGGSALVGTTSFPIRIGGSGRHLDGQITLDFDTSLNVWRIDGYLRETTTGISCSTFKGFCTNPTTLSGLTFVTQAGSFDGASGSVTVTYR